VAPVSGRGHARVYSIDFLACRDMEDRDYRGAELCFIEPWIPLLRERDAVEFDVADDDVDLLERERRDGIHDP